MSCPSKNIKRNHKDTKAQRSTKQNKKNFVSWCLGGKERAIDILVTVHRQIAVFSLKTGFIGFCLLFLGVQVSLKHPFWLKSGIFHPVNGYIF